MDDLDISPYHEMVRGMRQQADQLARTTDLTVLQMPVSELVGQFNQSNFSNVDRYATHIDRLIAEGHYDALFCSQEEMIDY